MEKKKDVITSSLNCNNDSNGTERQIAALKKRVRQGRVREMEQKRELDELRAYVVGMSEKYTIETDLRHSERMYCEWRQRSVIVVGGHEIWQRKLQEIFSAWKFIGSQKDVSADSLKGKKYIVCNTGILTQACYQKIQMFRTEEQKVLYVHSGRPERCLQELERQLCLIGNL
ncbi:MAG: hypothetical protein Q4C58_03975 [Eubacteriales bacterium]|nr:hypothetical protein [Eubacteriales bacterium]